MKKYWIPVGDWHIGTGYDQARHFMQTLGYGEASTQAEADILMLLGGADLGKKPNRDAFEYACIEYARDNGQQIFGVCRGMQILLASTGVELISHIPDVPLLLEHRTLTGNWKGQSGWHTTDLGLLVNTRHHQGALKADGWEILDRYSDGIIETVYRKNEFGVQWHPEHPEMYNTFANQWLAEELKKRGFT